MYDDEIIETMKELHEASKGTEFEGEVLKAKEKIEDLIDSEITQRKADGAHEDYLADLEE